MSTPLSEVRAAAWDVIVIGAGMGGAATAWGLADRGLRVLVIERGHETHGPDTSAITDSLDDPDRRLAAGRWPEKIGGRVDGRAFDFHAPLGSGVGGSTLLYAAALDRFRPSDFAPRPHPDGGTLAWPVGFDEFRHWYSRAETALGVTGTPDPLDPAAETDHLGIPVSLGPRDADLARRFRRAGLHPYRLHAGFAPGKDRTRDCSACLGNLCPTGCKRHAGNSFLAPARATGRVAVLSRAEVLRFEASATRVEAVTLRLDGATHRLTAPVFVLAAGAYFSPVLLLRSTSAAWPAGLGNRHDQVGRHLMFHTTRSLAVWSSRAHPHHGSGKSLVLRDFYDTPLGKFGEVQSVGLEASYGYTLYALRQMLTQSRFARIPLLSQLARLPALAAAALLGRAAIFDLMMEDLPYAQNRVALDPAAPSGMRFDYTVTDELSDRFERYGRLVRARLKGTRTLFLTHGVQLNHGHPMGTCRIGRDPVSSVADPGGRVHGLDNLYIGDGSFLPSSGGTNPSLTIAAHGLRLAAGIADSHARAAAQATSGTPARRRPKPQPAEPAPTGRP